jgi:hypothetical protein
VHEKLQHVVLAHLSEENNQPEIALQAALDSLQTNPYCKETAIRISVASQGCVGELVSLSKR